MTYCEHCEHMHPEKARNRYRMCMKFPRLRGPAGFVTEDEWDERGPYMYCIDINGGACPLFEKKRDEQMEMMDATQT